MQSSDNTDDTHWPLPLWLLKEQRTKPDTVNIKVDAKKLPSLLAKFSVANRVSIRLELKMVASILKLGGADIFDMNLSKSTIHRQRTKTIKSKAKQFSENFECPEHIVIHWDGKIIQVMLGLTEDRVAVVLSSTSGIMGKFLASPAIPSGAGRAQATAVHQVCQQWNFTNGKAIKRVVFWHNSFQFNGHQSGAAVLHGEDDWLCCVLPGMQTSYSRIAHQSSQWRLSVVLLMVGS